MSDVVNNETMSSKLTILAFKFRTWIIDFGTELSGK